MRQGLLVFGCVVAFGGGLTALAYRPLVTGRTEAGVCGSAGSNVLGFLRHEPGVFAIVAFEGRLPRTAIFLDDGRLFVVEHLRRYQTVSFDVAAVKRELEASRIRSLEPGCFVTWSPLMST